MQKIVLFIFLISVVFNSCKKEPGTGGTSSIKGIVTVHDYNGLPPQFYDPQVYVSQEDDVYIIYGDENTTYSDRTKTSYDGSFEFKYLRKGTYKVFVYSDDTSSTALLHVKIVNGLDISIGKNKSTVQADGLVILKE